MDTIMILQGFYAVNWVFWTSSFPAVCHQTQTRVGLKEAVINAGETLVFFFFLSLMLCCLLVWFSGMSVLISGERNTTHRQIMPTRSASWAAHVTLILCRISTCYPGAGEHKSICVWASCEKDKMKCTAM